jgi:hypothetical protein
MEYPMTKNVAKSNKNEVANMDYYEDFAVDTADLIIPKIMLMQKVSKKVEEEEAKVGEFRENVGNKLLGDKKTNLIIAPIRPIKKIYCETVKDKQNNIISYAEVPAVPGKKLAISEQTDEGLLERQEAYQLFCLPLEELDSFIAAEAKPFPYVITFKGASYYAGRQVFQAQFMYKNMRKPPFALSFEISSTQATSKMGGHTYYKMEVKKTEEIIDKDRLFLLRELFKDLETVSVKVADNDEEFF